MLCGIGAATPAADGAVGGALPSVRRNCGGGHPKMYGMRAAFIVSAATFPRSRLRGTAQNLAHNEQLFLRHL